MNSKLTENYAPVILFVYARPVHTKRVLDALKVNDLAIKTNLVIFSDAAKSDNDKQAVAEVRKVISQIDGFKTIKIIERKENYGLAKSIINGVSSVMECYGKAIILEDDIEASPYFLTFMNLALDKYKDNKNVWHISGWNYPIDKTGIGDAFFWRVMNCWGWATWQDRWQYYQKDPQQLLNKWHKEEISRFNIDNTYNFWWQVVANAKGELNTWAIFWYATIFTNKGYCLNPTESFVNNIGIDGSGENCGDKDIYRSLLNDKSTLDLPEEVTENTLALARVKLFYTQSKPSLFARIKYRIKRVLSL